jgi:signal transduction histidine kinase
VCEFINSSGFRQDNAGGNSDGFFVDFAPPLLSSNLILYNDYRLSRDKPNARKIDFWNKSHRTVSRMRPRSAVVLGAGVSVLAVAHYFIFYVSVSSVLKPVQPRPSFGRSALWFVGSDIVSLILVGVVLFLLLGRFVTRRLERIARALTQTEGPKGPAARIPEDRFDDEITRLVRGVNALMERLERECFSREQAEKTMLMNDRLVSLGRLSSCLAHEINNPLLALANGLQVLKKHGAGAGEAVREATALAEFEVGRIRGIVKGLLECHSPISDVRASFDAREAIRDALAILEWNRKISSFRLDVSLKTPLPIRGSTGQIRQVVLNLLLNAIEAVDAKRGIIRIEGLRPEGKGTAEISITDNGPGVAPSMKDRLFEAFASNKEADGVGLGLYISRHITTKHGGSLVLDPTYEPGSRFCISLPLDEGLP